MRSFVFVAHDTPSDGNWALDNLPGSGRADVMCRNAQAALCLSHGVRGDTNAYFVFQQPEGRVLRIQGAEIARLYPDERSTAARLSKALMQGSAGPDWKNVGSGIDVADLELDELLDELKGTPVLLDPEGQPAADAEMPDDPIFILSDHKPFTEAEYKLLADVRRMSLGSAWYHGNLVVGIIQYYLDGKLGVSPVR